jgi:hypothetical protein
MLLICFPATFDIPVTLYRFGVDGTSHRCCHLDHFIGLRRIAGRYGLTRQFYFIDGQPVFLDIPPPEKEVTPFHPRFQLRNRRLTESEGEMAPNALALAV